MDVQPAMDLIARNFGEGATGAFNLTIQKDACDSPAGKMALPFGQRNARYPRLSSESAALRLALGGCIVLAQQQVGKLSTGASG